ncbi:MAG: hypothetical protein FD145_262 [Candidatus Saganbacteria bacterium]|uniref:Endoribonuclease YbeY n=1 Tax=Candidatus Saganbacteria bacterium TaxID=2575572 RepID=A0A833P3L9_UNCSA|nr:MAG: hypothetical protein FD145_262 [Candidatus Saganbacteria bacterium]
MNNIEICASKESFFDAGIFKSVKISVVKILKENKLSGKLGITFIDDKEMKKLNNKYRKKNKSTDVLSFEINDNGVLGDVYISYPQAVKQAKAFSWSLKEEINRLALHGTLHVLGYTHKEMSKYGC